MARRPAIQKRRAPRAAPALQDAAAAGPEPVVDQAGADARDDGPQAQARQLHEDFVAMLAGDANLDAETRGQLGEIFKSAVDSAAASPDAGVELPDGGTWAASVEAIRQQGGIEDDDANALIRQLNQAMQPLERRQSRLAMEFSRRLVSDGEEKALEWLREQDLAEQSEESLHQQAAPARDRPAHLRTETTNSRSRRLRGPPRAR